MITEGIAKAVISSDVHPTRFEAFCNSLVSELEGGAPVVGTSRSWDQARDGRSKSHSGAFFTCCSLTDEVDSKARSDVETLLSKTNRIDRLYFCSNQPLSEFRCDGIEADLRLLVPPETSVIVYGVYQLAQLATRSSALLKHYRAEVEDCLAALRGTEEESPAELKALRLALFTVAHDTSDEIRDELYKSALRTIFVDGKPRNVAEACRDVSHFFRLHRNLPEEVVESHLKELLISGEVTIQRGRYTISDIGRTAMASQEGEAVRKLLDAKEAVRAQLEEAMGNSLANDQFDRIWKMLEDKIAHFFYTRGQEMVSVIGNLLRRPVEGAAGKSMSSFGFADELVAAAAAISSHPDQSDEIRTALRDLFYEPVGFAYDWLVHLCTGFIALCSLGLEAETGRALSRLISRMTLVFDTDVALSLCCPGEVDHESVIAIERRWKALGGTISVADPVLEEMAHHAWIAEADFEAVKNWIPGSREDRLRLIENAFVRGFAELLARGEAKKGHWDSYIGQFRGRSSGDVRRVTSYLHESGIIVLPPAAEEQSGVRKEVEGHLKWKAKQRAKRSLDLKIANDKAERDAALYATIVRRVKNIREHDPDASCLLVSSARRLAEAEGLLLDDPHLVVSIGAVLHMLSLVPGVSIGMGAMRAFLFEGRVARFSDDLERILLRVLRESDEIDMPWAKRGTLMREVRRRMVERARSSGVYQAGKIRLRDRRLSPPKAKDAVQAAEILRDSLGSLAIDTKLERHNWELQQTVQTLKQHLERLESEKKAQKSKPSKR